MDGTTLHFIAFVAFSVACFAAGYAARVRHWVHEDFSRRLHLTTLVGPWSLVMLLSLWLSPPGPQFAWLLVIEPVLVIGPALATLWLSRRLGFSPKRAAVLAVSAGLGNIGFTLGGFVCYTLLKDPAMLPPWIDDTTLVEEEGRRRATAAAALSYAIAQVTVMSVLAVVFLYPLAIRMGGDEHEAPPLSRLLRESFVDIRATQLYAAVAGSLLGWFGPRFPGVIEDLRLLDVLMFVGAGGAYAGIGLRLHVGHTLREIKAHAVLGVARFVFVPLLTVAMIGALRVAGFGQPELVEKVLIISAFCATAIQSVMIANLFHLDTKLASGLWVVNTGLCLALPIPLLVWWLA